jgi:hypothetical protein
MGLFASRLRVALVASTVTAGGLLVSVSGPASASTPAESGTVAGAAPVAADVQAAAAMPRCFGAASMAAKRCHNPSLRGKLIPQPSAARRDSAFFPGKQCYRAGDQQITLNRGCTFGARAKGRPHVIFVGDSHGRAMLPAFAAMAQAGHFSLEAQVRSSCQWTTSRVNHPKKSRIRPCKLYRNNLQRWLVRQASRTDIIVTTGYGRQVSGSASSQVKNMRSVWQPLIKRGVRIVAVSDNPRLKSDPQTCLTRHGAVKGAKKCGVSMKTGLVRDPFLLTARKTRGATALDLRSRFCKNGFCPAVIGGANVYRDHTHITVTYSKTLTPFLVARFRLMRLIR